MTRSSSIFITLMLTLVWVILVEDFSASTILVGLGVSICCTYFFYRALPWKKVTDVKFLNLVTYPFFLIKEVYVAGFSVIRSIIKGANVEVVELNTKLKSEYLRAVLAHSITLTPGTIALDMEGDKMQILWLRDPGEMPEISVADDMIKGTIEKRLLKAQKQENRKCSE